MRARNIKPGFFRNETLAECKFETRILFQGLWALADRKGRLEDRPKRIRADIFPYDMIEIEPLLQELIDHEFIVRYEAEGKHYIWIPTFQKHQSPHKTEKKSALPPCPLEGNDTETLDSQVCDEDCDEEEREINGEITVNPPNNNGESRPDSLNPDSPKKNKNTPTEGEPEPSPETCDGDIPVSEVPGAMREVVELFLAKVGRTGITPEELSAIRRLNELHYPTRVSREITAQLENFRERGKPPHDLTLEYILGVLKYQPGRDKAKSSKSADPLKKLSPGARAEVQQIRDNFWKHYPRVEKQLQADARLYELFGSVDEKTRARRRRNLGHRLKRYFYETKAKRDAGDMSGIMNALTFLDSFNWDEDVPESQRWQDPEQIYDLSGGDEDAHERAV